MLMRDFVDLFYRDAGSMSPGLPFRPTLAGLLSGVVGFLGLPADEGLGD